MVLPADAVTRVLAVIRTWLAERMEPLHRMVLPAVSVNGTSVTPSDTLARSSSTPLGSVSTISGPGLSNIFGPVLEPRLEYTARSTASVGGGMPPGGSGFTSGGDGWISRTVFFALRIGAGATVAPVIMTICVT